MILTIIAAIYSKSFELTLSDQKSNIKIGTLVVSEAKTYLSLQKGRVDIIQTPGTYQLKLSGEYQLTTIAKVHQTDRNQLLKIYSTDGQVIAFSYQQIQQRFKEEPRALAIITRDGPNNYNHRYQYQQTSAAKQAEQQPSLFERYKYFIIFGGLFMLFNSMAKSGPQPQAS